MRELKLRYNAILKQQSKAVAWFESDDFSNRFKAEGEPFFNKALARWNQYEALRIDILDKLEAHGEKVTREEIILGFEF